MRNTTQSRTAIGAALLMSTFFLFSVDLAQAQSSSRMRATIPFGFYVGERLMPAGEYELQVLENGVARVFNLDTYASVMFNTVRSANPAREFGPAQIIFNRYGEDHFLSEMWWAGHRDGAKPIPSKREHQLARANTPVRISVAR